MSEEASKPPPLLEQDPGRRGGYLSVDADETAGGHHEAPVSQPNAAFFYIGAVCLGFIIPWHWIYLAAVLTPPPATRAADRIDAMVQAALYVISLALFFAFRMPMLGWVRDCPENKGMSVSCLFQHQERRYVFFYVMHVIFLVWSVVHLVWDLAAGWKYVSRARRGEPMRVRLVPLYVTAITAVVCCLFLAFNAKNL